MRILYFILLFVPSWGMAQSELKQLVDSLKYVTDMPYMCESEIPYARGCGSREFWRAVKQKDAIIPLLINKLTDTTTTEAYVPNLGGQYAVADVAYFALYEIVDDVPTFELLGVPIDTNGCGFCAYWNHLRQNIRNRKKFQKAVRSWYREIKPRLVWVENGQPSNKYYPGGMFHVK